MRGGGAQPTDASIAARRRRGRPGGGTPHCGPPLGGARRGGGGRGAPLPPLKESVQRKRRDSSIPHQVAQQLQLLRLLQRDGRHHVVHGLLFACARPAGGGRRRGRVGTAETGTRSVRAARRTRPPLAPPAPRRAAPRRRPAGSRAPISRACGAARRQRRAGRGARGAATRGSPPVRVGGRAARASRRRRQAHWPDAATCVRAGCLCSALGVGRAAAVCGGAVGRGPWKAGHAAKRPQTLPRRVQPFLHPTTPRRTHHTRPPPEGARKQAAERTQPPARRPRSRPRARAPCCRAVPWERGRSCPAATLTPAPRHAPRRPRADRAGAGAGAVQAQSGRRAAGALGGGGAGGEAAGQPGSTQLPSARPQCDGHGGELAAPCSLRTACLLGGGRGAV